MKNKRLKNNVLKTQRIQDSRNMKKTSNVSPFDLDSFSEYPWWGRLLIKIILPHKNKFIDKIVDIGCLLTILIVGSVILLVVVWIFNLLQKVIY